MIRNVLQLVVAESGVDWSALNCGAVLLGEESEVGDESEERSMTSGVLSGLMVLAGENV